MGDFLKSTRFKILLGILVVLLAFMLRAAWTGGLSPMLAQAAGLIVTPIQQVASEISGTVRGYFERYVRADEISAENERLRAEVNELRAQMVDYAQYKQENDTLREFLDIKGDNPDFELEPAAVVARDPGSRSGSFTIDRGSIHGVAVRDPVISADGLIGVVSEVGANYAKINTILDARVSVGAYVVRTRDIGVVTGDITLAQENRCRMNYLPKESRVAGGDLVVTNGGGLFPKGLMVGKIARVGDEGGSPYAEIELAADIYNVRDVMVIKSFEGQEEITGES